MTHKLHLLTTRELADQIRRAPETLVRWRRLRVGPPFRVVQGRVLYDMTDIQRWLDSSSVQVSIRTKAKSHSTPAAKGSDGKSQVTE